MNIARQWVDRSTGRGCFLGRRDFLRAGVLVGASGIASGTLATTSAMTASLPQGAAGVRAELVHVRQPVSAVGDDASYYRLRSHLAERAINPWLRAWMNELDEHCPRRFEAIVETRQQGDGLVFGDLLDFCESFDREVKAPELPFTDWLVRFGPKERDDFLMAMTLYHVYGSTGEILPALKPTRDAWLDAMLGGTRGLLLWAGQWMELIRIVSGIGSVRATLLVRGYCRNDPIAVGSLNSMRYSGTGQRVTEIIEERSPGQRPWGSPDYLMADWLCRNWRPT